MDEAEKEQTRGAYDVVAASYARALPGTSYEAELDLAFVQHFVRELSGRTRTGILDAGCGAGRMMMYLRSLDTSLEVTGVDLSAAMVEQARRVNPSARIVQGDIDALPFATGEFEGVLAWYSIIHSPPADLAMTFAEFARVLRPGGLLLIAYQAGTGERMLRGAYGHDVNLRAFLHSTPRVEKSLEEAGLTRHSVLERAARDSERHDQAFVLARRA